MRELTETLLTAQKEASRIPALELVARNTVAGVVRLAWERLYEGQEDDYFHAVTMPGDGSLIRARITPVSDNHRILWQRVANPGPESDFSQWTLAGYPDSNTSVVTAASLGAEVSIFWIRANRSILHLKSTNYGVTWEEPVQIDYSPSIYNKGITAAYAPNGDIALFFTSQTTLFLKKRLNGLWQNNEAWDKTTGDLSGAAAVYDGDWNLLVSGQDASGNFKLWSLVYGDGGDVAAGTWSALKEFASAPSGENFEYHRLFMARPDVHRAFYIENFTGSPAASRPFWSHPVAGASFSDNLWREPVPLNLSAEYGLAICHHGDYCWLTTANGVWRAGLNQRSLGLATDILRLKQELSQKNGHLTVELSNEDGRYAQPGTGGLDVLAIGNDIVFSPGYLTSQGEENSPGPVYTLEAYEHTSSGGRASLLLHAYDGWSQVQDWRATHQFRWNKSADELPVKEILAIILARAGLRLKVLSQSAAVSGYYPDFTVSPGDGGGAVISKLLTFVPDVILIEGGKAYLINPRPDDSPVYTYGSGHHIAEGSYRREGWRLNQVQVEGRDPETGQPLIVNSFAWDEIDRLYSRLTHIEDRNIDSGDDAASRGQTILRQAAIAAGGGFIRVPVNCGQQPYDVISVTDSRAGLEGHLWRLLGLMLTYNPGGGQYEQRLYLGAV